MSRFVCVCSCYGYLCFVCWFHICFGYVDAEIFGTTSSSFAFEMGFLDFVLAPVFFGSFVFAVSRLPTRGPRALQGTPGEDKRGPERHKCRQEQPKRTPRAQEKLWSLKGPRGEAQEGPWSPKGGQARGEKDKRRQDKSKNRKRTIYSKGGEDPYKKRLVFL